MRLIKITIFAPRRFRMSLLTSCSIRYRRKWLEGTHVPSFIKKKEGMISEALIRQMVEEKLRDTGLFLMNVSIRKGNNILITIDGDTGVTIRDCVTLSRFIEGQFDREKEDFELQVSSAGADQPLMLKRQYPKHTGRTLEVKLLDETVKLGILKNVEDDHIKLELTPEKSNKKSKASAEEMLVVIPFESIKESKIIISFHI
ncbi:MAG: ribosome assembly cofactor RimP [Bacteroidetes bacterium]|nr:ribosome assembly cofactor RimP [Bacteroidota bacterium]